MRYLALIPLFVLALIPNSQPTQLDTSKAEKLVPSFFVAEKQEFPDRQTYTLQAQELDKQREIARLQAIRIAEASKVAEAQKNVPQAPTVAVSGDDNAYKLFIYNKESGNNPARYNSSGCLGLGQACPASKLLKVCPDINDYACQDAWFTNYAISRYGSWAGAYQFWLGHHWW